MGELITEDMRDAGINALIEDGWSEDSAGECDVGHIFKRMLEHYNATKDSLSPNDKDEG